MTQEERESLKIRIIGLLKLQGEFPIDHLAELIIKEVTR